MSRHSHDIVQSVFIAGLKNVHGVEHQALALIDRQLDHLIHYPEVADMLHKHRAETEQQIVRIEDILEGYGEHRSLLKDVALAVSGNLAAFAHMIAPDEILKNTFANFAFENFEAASYTSLIALANAGGLVKVTPLLQTSLGEELAMAAWLDSNNAALTMKYVERRAAEDIASH